MDTYTTSTYIIHLLPCHQDAGGHTTPPPATPEATSYIVLQNTSSLLLEEACTYTCRRLSLWEAWVYTLHVVHKGAHLAAGSCCIYLYKTHSGRGQQQPASQLHQDPLHTWLSAAVPYTPRWLPPCPDDNRTGSCCPHTGAAHTTQGRYPDAAQTPLQPVLQPAHGATSAHSTSVCASPSSPQGAAILDCVCIHCAS